MMSAGQANTTAGAIAVQVHAVGRVFRDAAGAPVAAIECLDLSIAAGEFIAILGPSGCGKSTLLRLVAGLDKPDTGSVTLTEDDRPAENARESQLPMAAPEAGAGLAYVFQDAHLLPWRNVLGNVTLPLELMGAPAQSRRAAAVAALEAVGLGDVLARYPAQLSGGMKMRVSLARALVTRPRLLLMDAPFGALDEITRQALDERLRQLWLERGMTVLFVTHSIQEAAFLADRAVVLSRRPARIVADRPVAMGVERTAGLRATAEFARQAGWLYEALRRGEGAP